MTERPHADKRRNGILIHVHLGVREKWPAVRIINRIVRIVSDGSIVTVRQVVDITQSCSRFQGSEQVNKALFSLTSNGIVDIRRIDNRVRVHRRKISTPNNSYVGELFLE